MKNKPKYKFSEEYQCWTCRHKSEKGAFGSETCKNKNSGVVYVCNNDKGVCDLWEPK